MNTNNVRFGAGGVTPPESDEALGRGESAQCFKGLGQVDGPDFHSVGIADQAADVIEGELYAQGWLQRQQAAIAQPGDLAVILGFLQGDMLVGACRLIEKAFARQVGVPQ